MIEIQGIAAAGGYAAGIARILRTSTTPIADHHVPLELRELEIARLRDKAAEAVRELEALLAHTSRTVGEEEAGIFAAHISILGDEEFTEEMVVRIREQGLNAEAALEEVSAELIALFQGMDTVYMQERAADFRDVRGRLLRLLQTDNNGSQETLRRQNGGEGVGKQQGQGGELRSVLDDKQGSVQNSEQISVQDGKQDSVHNSSILQNDRGEHRYQSEQHTSVKQGFFAYTKGNIQTFILVADDLTPSDTAALDRNVVQGFVTRFGGRTAHSAIMAKSMGIPAAVGLQKEADRIQDGDYLLLDGFRGLLYVNPTPACIADFEQRRRSYQARNAHYQSLIHSPTVTSDGHNLLLSANIGGVDDAMAARKAGAEGVGLFRSEFLYMDRSELPDEEEQFRAYVAVAEQFPAHHPVIIRTLDIGGDKELPYLPLPKEQNPFLGHRAIRLCLAAPELFKTQLRAILRASRHANVKLMFPMISTLAELREAKSLLHEARLELEARGEAYNADMEVGVMIEVPAAALIADQLAKECDFFSIGTNDLVQYVMAADRMNENVQYLSQMFHPAILRLIQNIVQAAHREGRWVGMCGEMAGLPHAIPLLLGLGLDELSMSGSAVLPARSLINSISLETARETAHTALTMSSDEEIQSYLYEVLSAIH